MDGDELSQHLIYHPSSPSFDIPDYLPLRRVKPLPKRKRSSPDPAGTLPLNTMLPPILPPPPGPDATAEELIAHAEVLSAQITFQSYFLPAALSGVADFARSNVEAPPPTDGVPTVVDIDVSPTEFCDEGTGGSGDHQMRQQGNAKKRKVPAHLSGSQMGPDSSDVHSGEEELPVERALPGFASPTGTPVTMEVATAVEVAPEVEPSGVGTDSRRGKMLPATMVGLRQKEMLKHRKRQLAAVLSAPMLGDSLALDQALLANYTFLNENRSGVARNARLKSRLMRRRPSRVVRRRCAQPAPPSTSPTGRIVPDSEFTFLRLNTASERLVATRTEYTVLYDRFENEVVRQAEKAAKNAKTRTVAGPGAVGVAKRGERAVRKARAVAAQSIQDTEIPAASKLPPSSTKTSGKKKKRSALANASNPHHLRNYVPSRIPNPTQLSAAQIGANAQNLLSPLPLLFLSAQAPPRRSAQARPTAAASQIANPAEEWICPTCEYRLFYGDDKQGYRIGVRNRKKILKRRRRARERAAAAANGSGTGASVHGKGSGFDDEEDLDFETTGSGLALSQTRLAKVERDKDGDNLGLGLGGAG